MCNNPVKNSYEYWLNSSEVDNGTKDELKKIKSNKQEIKLRFISYLEFGTAGLRGEMKAGTYMMNIYTVRHATQGFAEYILKENKSDRGVVIAYDSRNNSKEFAREAACVMAANNIPVYLFGEIKPTPMLSYAVRELKCIAGINITASHNPKEYNGYKAYWEDGAQLAPDQAYEVSVFIKSTDIFKGVKTMDYNEAESSGLIKIIDKDFDEKYISEVISQAVNPDVIKETADDLKIVYTPLHGTGRVIIPEVLERIGVKYLYTVPEQMIADGNFPTVKFPNPEYKEVFDLGIQIAKKIDSDLIIATDPDADRTGIMVRGNDGNFITFTGNQVGALLLDYIIAALKSKNIMPAEPYAVKTIVTTELVTKICEENNVKLHNVLTGFKFIGEIIKQHEASGHGDFIFGFEESYGYLKGTYARDKDAVVTSMLLCEMAAFYKKQGMTLYDALTAMYKKYGYYTESTDSLDYKKFDGIQKMKNIMAHIRNNPPVTLGGEKIVSLSDYQKGTMTDLCTGKVDPTGLPPSDVLYYKTEKGNVTVIRPSGTEPKIKIYYLLHAPASVDSFKSDSYIQKIRAF